jgi:hypothetical protein
MTVGSVSMSAGFFFRKYLQRNCPKVLVETLECMSRESCPEGPSLLLTGVVLKSPLAGVVLKSSLSRGKQ